VATGIPLGILVGFWSGAAFIFCLRAAWDGEMLKAAASVLTIAPAVFGGGWLTSTFDVEDVLSWYVTALAATAVPLGSIPLFAYVVRLTRDILAPR
jgi:hypothetical protein